MEISLRVLSLIIYAILGLTLAYRWIVTLPSDCSKKHRYLATRFYFVLCWAGAFILANYQSKISQMYFDPLDFPGDRGVTADVVYDGTGNGALALFFGWIFAPLFIVIARRIKLTLQMLHPRMYQLRELSEP